MPVTNCFIIRSRFVFQIAAGCRLESVSWVHFSGGEPTLWKEGNRSLIDLLLEISIKGFTPGFTTNGSYFALRLYLSIDTFHKNFDTAKGRARSLDNIMKYTRKLPRARADLLDITVMAVISKDFKSLLPDGMIEHYESLGINFGFVPLLPVGRAKSFDHLCPDLSSDDPEDLGAYRRFFQKNEVKRREKKEVDIERIS